MDNFEKDRAVVKGMLALKKKKLDSFMDKGADMSVVYINGIEHEATTLQIIPCIINEIKQNTASMQDESVLRIYGQ